MLLVDRGNEPGCGHVCAEVDDAESGRLPHDNHQVLADVVQVSLDRADHGRVLGRDACGEQSRFQQVHRLLHRAGRDQHLGDEDLVVLEPLAHRGHRGHQGLVDKHGGRGPLIEGPLREGPGVLALAGSDGFGKQFERGHGIGGVG
jgi:hypothetical protein